MYINPLFFSCVQIRTLTLIHTNAYTHADYRIGRHKSFSTILSQTFLLPRFKCRGTEKQTCAFVCTHTNICIYTYAFTHIHMYMYMLVLLCTYVYIYICIYICIYIYTYIYICICIYILIYIYICIHIYLGVRKFNNKHVH